MKSHTQKSREIIFNFMINKKVQTISVRKVVNTTAKATGVNEHSICRIIKIIWKYKR